MSIHFEETTYQLTEGLMDRLQGIAHTALSNGNYGRLRGVAEVLEVLERYETLFIDPEFMDENDRAE